MRNAFAGKNEAPKETELASMLGRTYGIWKDLLTELRRALQLDGQEWKTHSTKAGWSLRLLRRKRIILYLAPGRGCFSAALILGDKAIAAAKNGTHDARVQKLIATAKRYQEGSAIRIEVRGADDVEAVKVLANIKIEN